MQIDYPLAVGLGQDACALLQQACVRCVARQWAALADLGGGGGGYPSGRSPYEFHSVIHGRQARGGQQRARLAPPGGAQARCALLTGVQLAWQQRGLEVEQYRTGPAPFAEVAAGSGSRGRRPFAKKKLFDIASVCAPGIHNRT
jgi:hypothetical protein